MTENERAELEVCVDVLNSLIAKLQRIALQYNVQLDQDDGLSNYYKEMLKYVHNLRMTTNYADVIAARRKIAEIKEEFTKLEVDYDV